MRKSLKIILAVAIALASVFITLAAVYLGITAGTNLQPEKLIDYGKTVTVYDDNGEKIENTSLTTHKMSVKCENLSPHTINAFIASEDRQFYKHNGLNYKRILKAAFKNLTSMSFKEGASTISQQLIKNTHLNNDKTISRKLKEIKLTKQLERRYEKDEILEMYLNTIYFGHNCYGLQKAAHFYFDKDAENLTLEESATIVGLLTSPNNYSPFKNPEKSVKRRNTVLKNMYDCGYIDEKTYENAVKMPLNAVQSNGNERYADYLYAVIDELEELQIDPYGQLSRLKISTYLDPNVQNALESETPDCDYAYFVRNNFGGVAGYRSSINGAKRQIGSTAKPLFVYAPAIEQKKLHLFTRICDEKVDFNGYSPENYDKKYHGNVTVADSIKYSYNVPAVKTLNSLDLDEVAKYAEKMGITLEKEDKNLSLALGGMKNGLTIKQLTDCYSVFPSGGSFRPSRFIKQICDQNGKIIYKDEGERNNVFSAGTCSLITDALIGTAKQGTARKLKELPFDIACKTGTCGTAEGNTDAYAVGYTSKHTFSVWLGDANNKKLDITGGKDCCNILFKVAPKIYNGTAPAPLDVSLGTVTVDIDKELYLDDGKILLSDDCAPKLNKLTVKCAENNLPLVKSTRFSTPTINNPAFTVTNNKICIELCQTKYYSYVVKRTNNNSSEEIYRGDWTKEVCDEPPDGEYRYSVTPLFENGGKVYEGKEIILPKVIIRRNSDEKKLPDIVNKDWYNQ